MIYLDNAATTLQKPPQVAEAVLSAMGQLASPGRGGYPAAMAAADAVFRCRKLAGRLTRIRLMQLPALAEETRLRVDRNANTSLLVTEFCARLRELAGQ